MTMRLDRLIHYRILMFWLLSIGLSAWAVNVLIGTPTIVTDTESGNIHRIDNPETEIIYPPHEGAIVPYRIPTGFYIHSLAFVTASDVNITGYLWQLYPPDYPEEFKKGVIFPEEVNADSTVLRRSYLNTSDEGVLIGWYFDITLRQSFDYSRYPLDRHTIWLRLWPTDITQQKRILFVPDFGSYENTQKNIFGLDEDIVPGEWEIDDIFYSYNPLKYDTNFGFRDTPKSHTRHEFHYNIIVKRKFINAFIINLAPLLVVALLLYATLLSGSANPEQRERFGFTPMAILSVCSALFFVVITAHLRIRGLFTDSGLVYIEKFYLMMYTALLFTVINAYLLTIPKHPITGILHYHNNLTPKLTYWPILLWSLVLITRLSLQ